jgi:hypothetical protein
MAPQHFSKVISDILINDLVLALKLYILLLFRGVGDNILSYNLCAVTDLSVRVPTSINPHSLTGAEEDHHQTNIDFDKIRSILIIKYKQFILIFPFILMTIILFYFYNI